MKLTTLCLGLNFGIVVFFGLSQVGCARPTAGTRFASGLGSAENPDSRVPKKPYEYDRTGATYNNTASPECKQDPESCRILLETPVHSIESYADLKKLIDDNEIKSVDQLIPLLPTDFKRGYALIYNSRAQKRRLSSATTPRVVIFGVTGNFILAYNGNADKRAVETIETIEFNQASKSSILREIPFSGLAKPILETVTENPSRCVVCHRNKGSREVKAIWDQYNMWPGVYGSLSRRGFDFIQINSPEFQKLEQFLAVKDANPRYRALEVSKEFLNVDGSLKRLSEVSKERAKFDPTIQDDAIVFANGHSSHGNQVLSMAVTRQNMQRVGRMFLQVPKEKRDAFQYLIEGLSKGLNLALIDNQNPQQINQWAISPTSVGSNRLHFLEAAQCDGHFDEFFPAPTNGAATPRFASYNEVLKSVHAIGNQDYLSVKKRLGDENHGLTRIFQTPDPSDPYDLKTSPSRTYDPFNTLASVDTYRDVAYIDFAMRTLRLDDRELSTLTGFDRPDGDVTGRFQLLSGNSMDCSRGRGEVKLTSCYYLEQYVFFDKFIAREFYSDPEIHRLNCSELARRSRDAIASYLRTTASH